MTKSQIKKRSMAALLTLAMAVSLCCAFAGTTQAKTSLPAVEEIKTSATEADPFTILEIVPEEDQGSVGYYIDGEEPWVVLAGEQPKSNRESYVESTLRSLLNKSQTDDENAENNYSIALCDPTPLPTGAEKSDYPLNYVGDYSEVYPWVWAADPTTYADYTKQMPLAAAESGTAKGAMAYVGMGYGDYIIGDYEYVGPTGACVQLIKGFSSTDTGEGYWYNVSFVELTYKEIEDLAGNTTIDPDSEAATWTVIYEDGTVGDLEVGGKHYKYVGIVGDRDFPGLEVGKTYYKAVLGKSGEPYTTQAAANLADSSEEYDSLFADISGSFRDKETDEIGYFSKISYEYVGDGNGTYAFTPSGTGTDYNVKTKIVYYKGGYTNNNWFLKHVFDFDDSEITDGSVTKPCLSVNTVAASEVTQAQYNAADMIVLNFGFDITATTFSGIYKNDFSSSYLPALIMAKIATSSKPVVFDYNLINLTSAQGSCVQDTAEALLSAALANRSDAGYNFSTDDGHTFVGGNIYCIDGTGWSVGSGEDVETHSALPLATVDFNSAGAIDGDHLLKSDAFYPVFEEIFYENFLREIRGDEDEKLDADITMATNIRYIINFANTRQIDDKTTVRVLDIEPRTGSLSRSDEPNETTQISSLADWLKISEDNLIVTTMSTAEFVGLKADISEDYDLLYIGDSADGFNTDDTWFSKYISGLSWKTYSFNYITYNDNTMSYRESSSDSSINEDTVAEYIDNRQNASWFFNMQASDIVFGMRYTSIGDKVTSGSEYKLSGLLDRDYKENHSASYLGHTYNFGTVIKDTGDTNTFRYSGNDLTEAASQKIEDFASNGYPVILADSLLQPPEFDDSSTVATAKATPYIVQRSYAAQPDIKISDSILKVSMSSASIFFYTIYSANCQLYKNGAPVTDSDGNPVIQTISPNRSASFNLSDYGYETDDTFYCTVTITKVRRFLFWSTDVDSAVTGKTATVTIRKNAEPMFVDNSSVMYETINNIVGKANVMNWSSLTSTVTDLKQTLLKRFVNLSKPTIEFWNKTDADYYPTSYAMDATSGIMNALTDEDSDGVYELNYVFKITNEADPYPTRTRYSCNLHLDLNGNGLFEDDESVTDFALRDWTIYSASYGSAGLRVKNGELQGSYGSDDDNQHYYYISYEMPSDMVGIVPWKLEVTDTTYFGGHDSVIDYTRVAPTDPKTINILQINSTGSSNFSLQSNIASSYIFKDLFDEVASDFKVNIATVKSDFDTAWVDNTTQYKEKDENGNDQTVTVALTKTEGKYVKTTTTTAGTTTEEYNSITELLESYDMLIIGFGDAYKDLDLDVTKALADYINADKPVLMTHDTLSFYSLKDGGYLTSESDGWYGPIFGWHITEDYVYGSATTTYGYYPNMLIRDLIGMDRYGVTSLDKLSEDQSIGITKYADASLKAYIQTLPGFSGWNGGYVPSTVYYNNTWIGEVQRNVFDKIADAGYSIAWKADESRNQTVSETQGLTNGVLFRFMDSELIDWLLGGDIDSYSVRYTNDSSRLGLTAKVSQVNKGQITTYPFNINTLAFTGDTYNPGGDNSMPVQLTHAQNYQLNMNSDDMVVWYCLADDSYNDGVYQKNDVVNAYYVYTCGNVTYTGSGHTNDYNQSYEGSSEAVKNEAKLFVNTMIAAYRVVLSNSSVSFSNEDGTVKGITDFFVVTDGDTVLQTNSKYSDTARNIYFTVNDTNVDPAKIMEATFKYDEYSLPLAIYDADTDEKVYDGTGFAGNNKSLVSTYTYYVKLDDVISAIKTGTNKTVLTVTDLNKNLKITLTTYYGSNTPLTKTDDLNMRQYRLFDLS
ncbi:MAG: DUF5057 domain-containing protein [Clostridia bacterium]|nr:DUF5057 domain-containing protein [Clostridia bacterium]